MAKTDYQSVTEYIAAQPVAVRPQLERVRAVLKRALPKAEEVISYQIPAYRMPGGVVIFFSGWKEHYAIYPVTPELIAKFKEQLEPYEYNSKGTLRLPYGKPVPARLLAAIAKALAERVAAKVAKKKARR